MSFTYDGVEYGSKTKCAVALVGAGKSIGDAAKAVGCTYQTVYVNVGKGKEKRSAEVANRWANKTAKKLASRGSSQNEIRCYTGLSEGAIKKIVDEVKSIVTKI
jgi:hypothetical protein